ncbi:MAG: DUF6119 family protein [Candidatus Limiplasma sp.]|nr:DUF6119 family protein [Candidatus Limiplasma sp.]MEA5145581.1 DUF6119 family protein [Candidatus Limiplasma sp.]
MRMTIYLYKQEVTDFTNLLEEDWLMPLEGQPATGAQLKRGFYTELKSQNKFDYETLAYMHTGSSVPSWLKLIHEGFEMPKTESSNCSAVVFVKCKGRIFAYTFGYAYSALNFSLIEPNFGLITVLNMCGSDKVRRVQGKTLEGSPFITFTQSLNAMSIIHQPFDVYRNLVTDISCPIDDEQYGKEAFGADALKIVVKDASIFEMDSYCNTFLEYFQQKTYQEYHDYIDYIRIVKNDPALLDHLDGLLCEALEQNDVFLNIVPVGFQLEEPELFRLSLADSKNRSTTEDYPTLSYSNVMDFIGKVIKFYMQKQKPTDILTMLKKIMVCPLSDEQQVSNRRKLYDNIAFECTFEKTRYAFASGVWYAIDLNYYQAMERELSHIPDITGELVLKPTHLNETEEDYNKRIGTESGYANFDRKNYQLPGYSKQRVEICDLLTANKDFICVKKMTSSADLNHLFAQMVVSAELLVGEDQYRDSIVKRAQESKKWDIDLSAKANGVNYVLAIISDKPGTLYQTLYTMAKINLIHQAKHVLNLGARVSLCKISVL